MDLILNIFKQLGADSTFFVQFVIFIIAFILLKIVLFDKLMFVIQHRENNTTKLLDRAEKSMTEVQKLSEQYKDKIDTAQTKAQNELLQKKVEIIEGQRAEIKKAEDRLSEEISQQKNLFSKRAGEYKDELFKSSKPMTDKLISKLTD